MDHAGYLATIRTESERFLEVLTTAAPDTRVPACGEWTAADLIWHLAEVQHHWAQVVGSRLDGDDVVPLDRPADGELVTVAARSGTGLLAALAGREPDEPCWSWHPEGGSVGWVARRQAHEALIHRVDAEQTAGRDVRPPPVTLAVDGVDEVLRVMVDGVPDWGELVLDGSHLRIACTNADASWLLATGRFVGTSPSTGTTYDLDAATVLAAGDEADPSDPPDATVTGPAWDLDRWLWGRGDPAEVEVAGDKELVSRFRRLLAEATQ